MLMQAKDLCFQLPGIRELDLCLPRTHTSQDTYCRMVSAATKKFWVQFKTTFLKLVHTFQQTALKCFQNLIKYLFKNSRFTGRPQSQKCITPLV